MSNNLCDPSIFTIHRLGHTLSFFLPCELLHFWNLLSTLPSQCPPTSFSTHSHHSILNVIQNFECPNPPILFQFTGSPLPSLPSSLSSFSTNLGTCVWSPKNSYSKACDYVASLCFWQIHPTKFHLHLLLDNLVESVERERRLWWGAGVVGVRGSNSNHS